MVIEHLDGQICLKSSYIIGYGMGIDSTTKWIKVYLDKQEPILFRCGDRLTSYSLDEEQYYQLLDGLKKLNIENL